MDDERLTTARVARLATTDPDGRPHLVPIVFVLDGKTLYSAVDRKPKRSTPLRRIENARARPDVTILVDHYDEDWSLWWIGLRGRARVLDDGDERERALALAGGEGPAVPRRTARWARARSRRHRGARMAELTSSTFESLRMRLQPLL